MLAPVPAGVDILEGSSLVKIVAEEGEMRYLVWRVDIKLSLKPAEARVRSLLLFSKESEATSYFGSVPTDDERIPELTPFVYLFNG